MLQKGTSVIFKVVMKAMWFLLVSLGIIILGLFSHHERSPGTLRSPYGESIWEQGRDAVRAPAVGVFPAQGARHANECSYSLPPSDSNSMRYPTETHQAEPSQFPYHEQISDGDYFKSLFWGGLFNRKKISGTYIFFIPMENSIYQ